MTAPAITIVVFAGVFGSVYKGVIDRRVATVSGAAIILFLGAVFSFYSVHMAIDSIYFETLALIFGMSLISSTLSRSGLFSAIAARAAVYSLGNAWLILILFSLLTYLLSLTVNNLAAIVVILPVTLRLCREMKINPVPIMIAEIIASNLGGASTMIGDFPNMIISSAADIHFLDFLGGMMAPCLVLLAVMFVYFEFHRDEFHASSGGSASRKRKIASLFTEEQADHIKDEYLLRVGASVLLVTLAGFLFSEYLDTRPAYVALAAGLVLLVIGKFEKDELFESSGTGDILFFAGLFVMVGGLNAAGVLNVFTWVIETLGAGNITAELVALMWVASAATIFLNAGPSTAFFIPVAEEMSHYIPGHTVWWALSLGVLAGSSAALTGATAGSVASSHLDNFIKDHPDTAKLIPSGHGLDFKEFLRWGLPLTFIFLLVSSIYIALIA